MTRPAPDTDSEPKCWRCQSFAALFIRDACGQIVIFSSTKTESKGETTPGKDIQGRAFLGQQGGIADRSDQDFCHQTHSRGESRGFGQRHEWFKIGGDDAIKDTQGGERAGVHPSDPCIKLVW